MQQAHAKKESVAPISAARPVKRSMTMAGGFVIDPAGLPALQSGQSGERVIADKADDPKGEASAEALALITRLAEITQDIHDERFIQAAETVRAARRQLDAVDGYLQHLARKQATPSKCPRCKVAETHDTEGRAFCASCVSATYGRVRL
jgi:hypothetical protein